MIFATHLLPWVVEVDRETGAETLVRRKRHSALFAAAEAFAHHHIGLVDRPCAPETLVQLRQRNCRPVIVEKDVAFVCPCILSSVLSPFQGHYEGFCKGCLWPLFHYLSPNRYSERTDQNWAHYVAVNRLFAQEIAAVFTDGDSGIAYPEPVYAV